MTDRDIDAFKSSWTVDGARRLSGRAEAPRAVVRSAGSSTLRLPCGRSRDALAVRTAVRVRGFETGTADERLLRARGAERCRQLAAVAVLPAEACRICHKGQSALAPRLSLWTREQHRLVRGRVSVKRAKHAPDSQKLPVISLTNVAFCPARSSADQS